MDQGKGQTQLRRGTGWMLQGACKRRPDLDWVPSKESEKTFAPAKSVCDFCPVRVTCLKWATEIRTEGYLGGTTTNQRRRLRAVRKRAACPICRGKRLYRESGPVICASCGFSWREPVEVDNPRPQ